MANTGNTQQQINYGAAANDGQGDPLRTAFIKTDDNFDAIWNTGPVGSNITIVNNTIQSNNTNGNIVLRPNGVGVVQANAAVVPNATNLRDLGTTDLRFRAAYVGTGGLSVDGNVTVTGNLTAGNISYTGNVFVGDLQGSVYADDSTIMVDAVDNEMFADSATFGTANVTGNVSANFFIGNGSLLTGVAASYGNANVATFLASDFGTGGSNTIVTVGNVVASAIDVANITHEFPIRIQTSGGGVWQFAGNILSGPQGGSWDSSSGTSYFNSPANGYLNLSCLNLGNVVSEIFMEHSFIRFLVDNGGPEKTWQMNLNGEFSVPGDIIPQSNGTASLGNSTNYWSNLWVASNTVYIGGVPLGITAGNVLTVDGEAVLSNDSNATITTTGNITANYFLGNGSLLTGVASTGNITFSDTTVSPPDGVDITISAANSEVIIEALDIRLDSTDDLRLTGNDLVSLRNRSTTDPVTIITDYDDTETTWTFAVDGTLTTPGDIVVAGDVTGTSGASTLVLRAQPASNTSIQLNNSVDSVISTVANLEIRTDVSNTARTWEFDNTGNLVVPGNINFGGDACAAPNLNDFSSVTAAGDFDIVTGTGGTTRTFEFGADGRLILPESSEANVAKLTSPPNDANVSLQLYSGNAVRIVSNTTGEPFVWTFGTTGTFTAAGNISAGNIDTGIITLTNGAQIRDTAGNAVAFGRDAGKTSQGNRAVAIGLEAGTNSQGVGGVAIGEQAGHTSQGVLSVAIGYYAGANTQSFSAVAIGAQAGETAQGSGAIAIGDLAGRTNQANNSIILNATGANLDQITANTFTVAPVRNDVANVANVMFYNTTSKEITYGNTISVAGNVTGGNIITAGRVLASGNILGLNFGTEGSVQASEVQAGNITGANLSVTGNITGNTAGFAIGYRDIPQVSFTGNVTMAAADAGKHFYSTESTDYILTIADNSAVTWPVGTAITVVNRGTGNITVAQAAGVSLYLAGNSSAGNRTVSTYGMVTLLNVAANVWMINGTGVT